MFDCLHSNLEFKNMCTERMYLDSVRTSLLSSRCSSDQCHSCWMFSLLMCSLVLSPGSCHSNFRFTTGGLICNNVPWHNQLETTTSTTTKTNLASELTKKKMHWQVPKWQIFYLWFHKCIHDTLCSYVAWAFTIN